MGRFLNADAYASTGQGLLGNNMYAYCLNNPVNRTDVGGMLSVECYRDDGDLFDRMLEGSSGGGYGGAITAPLVLAISNSLSGDESKDVTISLPYDSQYRQYSVYFLYAEGGDPNTIVYVGRVVSNNFNARMAYHEKQGRLLSGAIHGLDYALCRVIEQGGMMYNHTINRDSQIHNQIRGISPSNKNLYTYLSAIFDLVGRDLYPENAFLPLSYWENFAENEFLNLGA